MPSQATHRGWAVGSPSPLITSEARSTGGFRRISHDAKEPAMTESVADIAAFDYPGSATMIADADLADWIQQQQTVQLPEDDYPTTVHRQPRQLSP